ncbi:hypothetical protein ACFPC0_35635 [Streptomyces andamanensis]|uniref:Deoxyribonuclease NucA/NucB domain-containing protein n=1 Tax=Streptomyces andamanensis TaxID=1565035 RepID=A0ABV8TR60_9ACTN
MSSPRTGRALSVLAALALTATLTATGTAVAADAGHSAVRTAPVSAAVPAPVDPAAPSAALRSTAFTAEDTCAPLTAAARAKVRSAVTACVSVDPAAGGKAAAARPQSTAPRAATAADDPDDPGTDPEFEPDGDDPEPPAPTCTVTNPGQWSWSRIGGLCLNGAEVTYTLYDEYAKPVGTGLIQVDSTLATSYKSLDLSESITARLVRVTGEVSSLEVKMEVGCGAGCTTKTKQPWFGAPVLTPGQQKTGTTKYNGGDFGTGTRTSFRTNYKMYVMMPGAVPLDPSASWSSPANALIRCDKEQPRLRGCVIPTDDLPVLSYSRSHEKYGIVVPVYEEIMRRRGTDVLHAVNQTKADANRAATCTPFTNLFPGQRGADSCDEFPPASTKEGGQDGSLCAELTPQVVNGVWSAPATWPARPATGSETCLRLHITQRANSSAGGVLGSLRKYQRLVDDDPFRIEFTA